MRFRLTMQWSCKAGIRFKLNPASGQNGTRTETRHPPASACYMPFLWQCTPILWFVNFTTYLLWCCIDRRHLYFISKPLDMLQIGSGIKEQIQSAFKCTRIFYPIWKIIQASGAILIQAQWTGLINISKLDQLIISPKATLKSKLDTEGDFICSFLGCLRSEIYCSYSRGQNNPHTALLLQSSSDGWSFFLQYSQLK